MYVCKKYTFGILIFVSDCIIVYYGCFFGMQRPMHFFF